jgi:methionine-rich copper-binding protein CopC
MKRRIFLVSLALATSTTPAFAHAFLQRAEPGAGATARASPGRVVLTFSEKLEPAFSGVGVTDAFGHSAEAGPVMIAGKAMVAPIRPLPPGRYRVTWHVVSVDTHRTEGAYSFTVKP